MGPDTDSVSSQSSHSLGDMLQVCRPCHCMLRDSLHQISILQQPELITIKWEFHSDTGDCAGCSWLQILQTGTLQTEEGFQVSDSQQTWLEQCIPSGQWITHWPETDCGLAWSLDNKFSSELEKWFTWHSSELTQLSRFCSYWATRECPTYRGQGRVFHSQCLVTSNPLCVLTGSEMARKSSIKLVQLMQFGKFDTRENSSKFELKFLFDRSLHAVVSHYLKECQPLN